MDQKPGGPSQIAWAAFGRHAGQHQTAPAVAGQQPTAPGHAAQHMHLSQHLRQVLDRDAEPILAEHMLQSLS